MKAVYKILTLTILSLITLAISIISNLNNNIENPDIIINYPQQSYFNKLIYVEKLMEDDYYKGLLKESSYNTIEKSISDTPGIEKAEVYKLYNGNIIIDLYDRKPLAFTNQDANLFIDKDSNLIIDNELELDLPILSNGSSKKEINETVKIILEINKDKYLADQVERFWFEDGEIFTSLKSFDFNIKIGNSYKIKEKIKKLKAYCAFYNKDSSNLNFNQIDLTYSNQLVAIKN